MGTMPNNKYCPKPTAAAVGQAAFCLSNGHRPRRRGQRVRFKMNKNCWALYPFFPCPSRSCRDCREALILGPLPGCVLTRIPPTLWASVV
eukprot:3388770-Pyramimonas_sp.AAC.1